MGFPPPPTNTIDWENVGFAVRPNNGHIECHYSTTTNQWSRPRLVRSPYIPLHAFSPGLNYGMTCYEGLKAFRLPPSPSSSTNTNNSDTIVLFRPSMNAARMAHSASYISVPAPPSALFTECCSLAVAHNAEFVPPHSSGASLYVRPLLFGSGAMLGLEVPDEFTFLVQVTPVGVYHGVKAVAALILEEFDRTAPRGTGNAKIGGNYAPVLRHSHGARREGYGITLHLDSGTRSEIDEFSTSGFVGVKKRLKDKGKEKGGAGGGEGGDWDEERDGYTIVIPDSERAIKSVTSDSACEIARSFGWEVVRRPVKYEELPEFSEVIAVGTAATMVPIKSITMRSKNDKFIYQNESEEPGPACMKLLTTLKGIQNGKLEDKFGWRVEVEEAKGFELEQQSEQTNGSIDKVQAL